MDVAVETFQPAAELSKYAKEYNWNEGTVEVAFQGRTQRVECIAPSDGGRKEWTIYGLAARYATGSKVWRATMTLNLETGRCRVSTGFDNRSGRFSEPRLVGFIAQSSEKNVSKR